MNFRSPIVLTAIGVIATLVLAVAVVMVLLRTGSSQAVSDNAGLIGALVALGGVFTAQMVGIALEDRRTQEARALEDRRTQEARELEDWRANEAALQKYFEDVGTLLIEKPLRRANPGDTLSSVVRAQTLTVLEGLDPDRTRILLQFLYESELIHRYKPVINLQGANLTKAHLSRTNLREANLISTNLSRADLSEAFLIEANLRLTNLREADLSGANLNGADLSRADLSDANLSDANLIKTNLRKASLLGADLSRTELMEANLSEAFLMEADLSRAMLSDATHMAVRVGPNDTDLREVKHLRAADLSKAHLLGANLSGAYLGGTNLSGADLSEADLSGANLRDADLSGVAGITNEELEQQAFSLEGAIMPDGSTHP